MAQESTDNSDQAKASVQERPNIVGAKPLNYKKWDDLEYESDEDDCHPNIEIGTWRRLKERMRKEKGIKKKEPYLVDKWDTTTVNKRYHIDPTKPPKTTEEQKSTETQNKGDNKTTETIEKSADSNDSIPPDSKTELKKESKTESKTESVDSNEAAAANSEKPSDTAPKPTSKSNGSLLYPEAHHEPESTEQITAKEEDDEPFKARTNPQTFLDENLDTLRKFAKIKNDSKAERFIKKNPELVHEASEGFLITLAVDRAVEGAQKPELARLSRRTLMIHNLVQSCSQQNCAPRIGVEHFYRKITTDPRVSAEYKTELGKQVQELLERIEVRRQERLAELQDIPADYEEEEKAPLGPGGLDPTEVLNSLPKEMQDAFVSQEVQRLRECLEAMDAEEAEYHMKRCIDAGLWVQPEEDEPQKEQVENEIGTSNGPKVDPID